MSESWVLKFTISEVRLLRKLNGIYALDTDFTEKHIIISNIHTFKKDYITFDEEKERVVTFAPLNSEKRQNRHSMCQRWIFVWETNQFRPTQTFLRQQRADEVDIFAFFITRNSRFCHEGLKRMFREGLHHKRTRNRFWGRQCLPTFVILQFKPQT